MIIHIDFLNRNNHKQKQLPFTYVTKCQRNLSPCFYVEAARVGTFVCSHHPVLLRSRFINFEKRKLKFCQICSFPVFSFFFNLYSLLIFLFFCGFNKLILKYIRDLSYFLSYVFNDAFLL